MKFYAHWATPSAGGPACNVVHEYKATTMQAVTDKFKINKMMLLYSGKSCCIVQTNQVLTIAQKKILYVCDSKKFGQW